jgi:hypothetical protein
MTSPCQHFESVRAAYDAMGPERWYREHGDTYINPHEAVIAHHIHRWVRSGACQWRSYIDIACGNGESTSSLMSAGLPRGDACDPYLADGYEKRHGIKPHAWSFQDIAKGACADQAWDGAVCSFALHLAPPSVLPHTCMMLSLSCARMLVITPHKRPHISPDWGWDMMDEYTHDRVRSRMYQSRYLR